MDPHDAIATEAVTQNDSIVIPFSNLIDLGLKGPGHILRGAMQSIVKKFKFHLAILKFTDLPFHHGTG
jgi:hypothetical protein